MYRGKFEWAVHASLVEPHTKWMNPRAISDSGEGALIVLTTTGIQD